MNKISVILGCLVIALSACQSTHPEGSGTRAPAAHEGESATAPDETEADSSNHTTLTENDRQIAERLDLDPEELARLIELPLYKFDEKDLNTYLPYVRELLPNLRDRVVHLGRKNLGQPYELYLLGEFPFETHDPLPLYNLEKSDCVVFSEHVYAMALSRDWPSFFSLLQRIRYADGQIGVASRNHYTEADWNPNNSWLVTEITRDVGGDDVIEYDQRVDRARFLKNRYNLVRDIQVEKITEPFIPFERIEEVKPHLRNGDFVNIVNGREGGYWVGHVGLISIGDDGTVNLLHSAQPEVVEQPLDEFISQRTARIAEQDAAGRARLHGFKFLRLEDTPLANLRAIDGPEAPRIQAPGGADLSRLMNDPTQSPIDTTCRESEPKVLPGIDLLLTEHRDLLRGKRVGLITNPTGITSDNRQNIDALVADDDIDLVALFGPEHGVRGEFYAGDKVSSEVDSVTGIQMHSLYGATRRPKPEWLEELDVLVYDVMDTTNRSYTFVYTMAYAMEAARDAGIPFIVADRPAPMGGNLVDGNILDVSKGTSFVGLYPVAYLYGMTPGELARYFNSEFDINCDLEVVEMEGWRRDMTFDQTGLLWVLPSQHVPRWETTYYMAISGIFGELHTMNEGVGFTLPFEMVGAPWIDRQEFADELNSRSLPGIFFRPHVWVPRYGTHDGEKVQGVQMHITDYSTVQPVSTSMHILEAIQKLYPEHKPLGDEEDERSQGRIRMFNRVVGTDTIRRDLLAGKTAEEIIASWQPEVEAFMETRAQYLIYR